MNPKTAKARPTPKQTEARLKAARRNPCFTCASPDCETCINSPENSVPIRLYTPKGAARAMLVGMILRDIKGNTYFWDSENSCFRCNPKNGGQTTAIFDFSGLYVEID
jgi:hypothetical protein